MFWQMISIEQSKIFKRAILWVELGLFGLAAVFLPLIIYTALGTTERLESVNVEVEGVPPGVDTTTFLRESVAWPSGLNIGLDMAAGNGLGGMLIIILVGAFVAQEYTWRTFHLWLSQGISRPLLIGAKFIALLLPALLIVVVPFVVGGATTAVISRQLTGTIPFNDINWPQLGLRILRITYTLLPYAGLTFFLAVLSRSTVVSIGAGLAYALLIEGIVGQLLSFVGGTWANITQYLPAGLAQSLIGLDSEAAAIADDFGVTLQLLEPGTAALYIALYTLLFIGLSVWLFGRQDLTG